MNGFYLAKLIRVLKPLCGKKFFFICMCAFTHACSLEGTCCALIGTKSWHCAPAKL